MNPFNAVLLLGASAFACAGLAHKGADHDKKAPTVKKEQKAWGIAGATKSAQRTVQVTMSDRMRFTPGHYQAGMVGKVSVTAK